MALLEHFLLTNFNVVREDHDRDASGAPVLTGEWLEHRFDLFERFCLPSVAGQSASDFTWLVRWDEDGMPEDHRARLRDHAAALPAMALVPGDRAFWVEIARRVGGARRRVLTSRLDNDDALHRDALATLRDAVGERDLEFLNLPHGYCHRHPGGPTYRVDDWSSPFISLVETVDRTPPMTAVCVSHVEAARVAPVRQVGDYPAWVQVIHGRNLHNRLRGRPCPEPDLAGEFSVAPAP
jgi:putative rhamnosyltransferase